MGAAALAEDRWDHVEGTSFRSVESLIWAPRRNPGESGEMVRRAQREAGDRAASTSRSAQSRDRMLECLPAIIRCEQPPATSPCPLFAWGRSSTKSSQQPASSDRAKKFSAGQETSPEVAAVDPVVVVGVAAALPEAHFA
ncbi:hypothetical protein AXG93_3556s1070 [Marchantia polymorpha subsp. ruderalis]|uniref:Uncharacterized protein n=1 Tax=Marchantia polymorpha subsp. ruderalis TaxID=1480154 RepID=A0A176WI02_MARPO|nr:hypothetical protein AXG93_3556s1070 [Marchantia polymorpha subsp. ruderalis]